MLRRSVIVEGEALLVSVSFWETVLMVCSRSWMRFSRALRRSSTDWEVI
jgi:hypothetical protein